MKKNYKYETENQSKDRVQDENLVKSTVRKVGKTTIDTGATVLGVTAGFVAAGVIIKVAGKAINDIKNVVSSKMGKKAAEVDEITDDEILCENESDAEEETDNE